MNFNDVDKYYNNKMNEITKQIDIHKELYYVFSETNNTVEIYVDENKKIKAEFAIIGMYNIPMSIWYWGWNIAFINKNLIKPLSNVKNFITVLNKDYDKFNPKEAEVLHYILSNGNYYISNKNLEKVIKIALYLTKGL